MAAAEPDEAERDEDGYMDPPDDDELLEAKANFIAVQARKNELETELMKVRQELAKFEGDDCVTLEPIRQPVMLTYPDGKLKGVFEFETIVKHLLCRRIPVSSGAEILGYQNPIKEDGTPLVNEDPLRNPNLLSDETLQEIRTSYENCQPASEQSSDDEDYEDNIYLQALQHWLKDEHDHLSYIPMRYIHDLIFPLDISYGGYNYDEDIQIFDVRPDVATFEMGEHNMVTERYAIMSNGKAAYLYHEEFRKNLYKLDPEKLAMAFDEDPATIEEADQDYSIRESFFKHLQQFEDKDFVNDRIYDLFTCRVSEDDLSLFLKLRNFCEDFYGRGKYISNYDDEEHEYGFLGVTYYIYRMKVPDFEAVAQNMHASMMQDRPDAGIMQFNFNYTVLPAPPRLTRS